LHKYKLLSPGRLLKVLTNEERGGLKVVSIDRSRFQLFTLKFSKKSVQTPSCERAIPPTLCRYLETVIDFKCHKKGFQTTAKCRRCMKRSKKLARHVLNLNNAIHSFFADSPNIAGNCHVIWKDIW
jgi:hypothetical protein